MSRSQSCRLLAAAAIFAATAAAQSALQCVANAAVPSLLRAEGVAEEVGQIVINCTGGTPIAAGQPLPRINVQVNLNANVTSRLLGTLADRSEALLLLDEPTPAEQVEAPAVPFTGTVNALGDGVYKGAGRPNVFGSTAGNLQWSGIPFDPPGDNRNRIIRIVNMRVNAAQIGVGSEDIPNSITAFISVTGAVPLTIANSALKVGIIQSGLKFSAAASNPRCQSGAEIYSVSFAELFGTSFRHKSATGDQNVPGTIYGTESMFYNTAFTGIGAGAGLATQGTRLSLRFANIPANVTITVPTTGSSPAGDMATLVATGTNGSTANPVTGVVTLTGGAGTAVYEVTASNPAAISTLTLAVSVAPAGGTPPGLGIVTVAGQYTPIATTLLGSADAAPRFIENPNSASTFTMETCAGTPVTLSLNRAALAFAATVGGSTVSPTQDVSLAMAGANNNWTATSNAPWLSATPASGRGSGRFNIGIVPSALPAPGTHTGTVTVNASGAINGPLALTCTLTVTSSATIPFGSMDTPIDNTTGITGSIAVTGWALDDIGVKQVTIWRDRVGTEPVNSNGLVYIGDALFIAGTRPDVETKYSTYPNAYRAGWGYLMLTYGLPAQGNGTFKIHAFAVDQEGNQLKLGTRTISVDNLHSVKPFGALDLPQPGETISGSYPVQGWALTPQPASIDANGSTIWVHVDGVNLAHPGPLQFRDDIFAIFPGYANSNTSAGSYAFDSTTYANGMHNIAWVLTDNLGRTDGIGSRFFYILNNATSTAAAPEPVQLRAARRQRQAEPEANYPAFRFGYSPNTPLTPIHQGGKGLLEPVALNELGRVELHHLPSGQQWSAALRFGEALRDLPIGSTFDAEGGIFYWQLGPGFLGEFNLEFSNAAGTILNIPVVIGARTTSTAIQ